MRADRKSVGAGITGLYGNPMPCAEVGFSGCGFHVNKPPNRSSKPMKKQASTVMTARLTGRASEEG